MITAMRKPGLAVREGRVRKSRSVAGNGLLRASGCSGGAAGGLCVVGSIVLFLFAFQISFDSLFSVADGACQFYLRQVVRVKTLDVTFMSAGDRLLGLHYFQVVGNPGTESIPRLRKCLFRQLHGTARDLDLIGSGVQIQQSTADFIINAAAKIPQLRTRLLQLGFGFQHVAMNLSAGKNGDGKTAVHLPCSIGLSRVGSDVAIVRVETKRRIVTRGSSTARELGGSDLRFRCLIVRAGEVGALQVDLDGQRSQRLIRGLLGQDKFLARGQADDARQGELLFGKVGASRNQLLFSSLQLDLRAQSVNGRIESGPLLINRFVVESLGIRHLSLRRFYSRSVRNGEQVSVPDREHHQFPGVFIVILRRFQALGGGTHLLEVLEVKNRLTYRGTSVEIIEGTNHSGNGKRENVALEAKRGQAFCLHIFLQLSLQVRQQITKLFPSFAPRRNCLIS